MKTALITGASTGLGFEFAKIFAKEKYNLIIVARNKEKLKYSAEVLEKQKVTANIIRKWQKSLKK